MRRAAVLVDLNYEELEVHYPRLRLVEAGFQVVVVGPVAGDTYTSKMGYWAKATHSFTDVDPSSLSVLIIPGGFAPDRLRRHAACLQLVSEAHRNGCVIGHICHGGWVAISAKILPGVKTTAFCAIKDDIVNAGAVWSDEKCVVDEEKRIVSAQTPEDLPAFMKAILQLARP